MLITIKNLHQATTRQVFDQVKEHLLKQNKQAKLDMEFGVHENCQYLAPDGLKCAAGCLIAPDEYKSDFEGYAWSDLVSNFSFPKNHF